MTASTVSPGRRHLHRAAEPHVVTVADFRTVAGLFGTGVAVVTTLRGTDGHGMTANAFASVSLDPLLVLVCVRRDSEMRRQVDAIHHFAVSVLAADQQPLAAWFANPARPRGRAQFDAVNWRAGNSTGAPILGGALAWMECAVAERVPAGDHTILIGRVLEVGVGEPGHPLLFFGGSYATTTPALAAAAGRATAT